MATASDFLIREAVEADAEQIISLVNEAYEIYEGRFKKDPRLDHKMLFSYYLNPATRIMRLYVYLETSVILGCIALQLQRGEKRDGAYFGLLATKVGLNKKGLAGRLVSHAEEQARKEGAQWMEITVVNIREEWLKNWYRKLGYIPCGTAPFPDPDRLFDSFKDKIVMDVMRKQLC